MELPDLPVLGEAPKEGYEPVRKIYTDKDMKEWEKCAVLTQIELVISRFAQAVRDQPISAECYVSDVCPLLLSLVYAR